MPKCRRQTESGANLQATWGFQPVRLAASLVLPVNIRQSAKLDGHALSSPQVRRPTEQMARRPSPSWSLRLIVVDAMHGFVTPSTHESAVLEQWMSYPDLASVRTETEDPIPLPEVRFGATHAPITGAHNLPTNDITAHVGCGDPNEARMADAFVGESNASLGTSSDNAGSKPDHAIEGHIIHAEPLSQPFVPSSITFSDFDFGSYETPGFDLSAMSNATESNTYSARSLGVPSWLLEELYVLSSLLLRRANVR